MRYQKKAIQKNVVTWTLDHLTKAPIILLSNLNKLLLNLSYYLTKDLTEILPRNVKNYFFESSGSNTFTIGAVTTIASEPFTKSPYVTVFVKHFLSFPSQNFRILRKLYIENDWSPTQISRFTGWHEASIRSGAKHHGIIKPKISPKGQIKYKERYGWRKTSNGNIVKHKSQQRNIDLALALCSGGKDLAEICRHFNSKGIATINGSKWDARSLKAVLERERNLKFD